MRSLIAVVVLVETAGPGSRSGRRPPSAAARAGRCPCSRRQVNERTGASLAIPPRVSWTRDQVTYSPSTFQSPTSASASRRPHPVFCGRTRRFLLLQLAAVDRAIKQAEHGIAEQPPPLPCFVVMWRFTPVGTPRLGILHSAECWTAKGERLTVREVQELRKQSGRCIEPCDVCGPGSAQVGGWVTWAVQSR